MAKTAAAGHEVHFVTIPGLRCWRTGRKKYRNITVHTLLPKSDKFPAAVRFYLNKQIGLQDAWLIVSNPLWAPVISRVKAAGIVYDQLDHFTVHAPGGKNIPRLRSREESLLTQADAITTVSRRLQSQSPFPGKTFLLPNGVPESFLKQPLPNASPKIIGFHGALYEWIDYDLLEEIAETFPDHILRLAGTVRDHNQLRKLLLKPNVEILPAFRFEQLPEIVNSFSIGIVPFKDDEVSRCADPLKIYEYLALGKSVVTTVPSAAEADVVITATRENFCQKISGLLSNMPSEEQCRSAAAEHTWEKRCRMLLKICGGSV